MKRIILIGTMVMLACGVATAANEKADQVKYEVTISVTYNAVTIEEANRIVADAIERHKAACKVSVSAKKGSSIDGNVITWGSLTPYVQTN